MSRQQWGHGFHTGIAKGHEDGYERGKAVHKMLEAEQIDVLIEQLAHLLSTEDIGPRHWATLRTISEVNSKNLISPERAWHARGKLSNAEVRGEGKRSLTESSAEGATSTVC